jgi:hypothetical protein
MVKRRPERSIREAKEFEVKALWDARPDGARRLDDSDAFSQEIWRDRSDLRLADDQSTHYQHITELVRFRTS